MSDSPVWHICAHFSYKSWFEFRQSSWRSVLFRFLLGATRQVLAWGFCPAWIVLAISAFLFRGLHCHLLLVGVTLLPGPKFNREPIHNILRNHDICYSVSRLCRPRGWGWRCSIVLWRGRYVIHCVRNGLNHCLPVTQQCWENLAQSPFIKISFLLYWSSPW
jgi:hypothetical protein